MEKRKPDSSRLQGKNEVKATSINGCIDFTIQNVGVEKIYFGFIKNVDPDIPLNPNEQSTWPLYRPDEEWEGELYVRFGVNGSVALILKTV
jgi:hypothetical protein